MPKSFLSAWILSKIASWKGYGLMSGMKDEDDESLRPLSLAIALFSFM